jgi:hypothetical protein
MGKIFVLPETQLNRNENTHVLLRLQELTPWKAQLMVQALQKTAEAIDQTARTSITDKEKQNICAEESP